MSRPQPYRIDWTSQPTDLDDCSQKIATQFESIDQMFQLLFEDLHEAGTTPGATGPTGPTGGTGASGPTGVANMAVVLTRVMVRN